MSTGVFDKQMTLELSGFGLSLREDTDFAVTNSDLKSSQNASVRY